ncbi:TetR family transcriptional regulator [Pseudomonas sp. SZ57]|nr:TetR family transcriptional regulator [Pseudomonas sp. SZ57]
MLKVFDLHIQRPVLSDDVGVFALAMEDRVYTRSVQLHDEITRHIAEECMRVLDAYLGLYSPVLWVKYFKVMT